MASRTARERTSTRIAAALLAALAVSLLGAVLPPPTSAHPLGNFTINRYNGLAIGPDWVQLDRVVDMAELPTLQARQQMDTDHDGAVADGEAAAWARQSCRSDAASLALKLAGRAVALSATGVGLTFAAGQAGLMTLRQVCTYEASLVTPESPAELTFSDDSYPGRQGWQEITVIGAGVALEGADAFAAGRSNRLRTYPTDGTLAGQSQASVTIRSVTASSATAPPRVVDAVAIDSADADVVRHDSGASAVRGGIDELPGQLSAAFGAAELSLPALAIALLLAALVGAFHAATPGHGKTLMAAYLVGSRGTARHALGLGLTVTISHTIGVLALGTVVMLADAAIPSERLLPALGLASGIVVTVLGVIFLGQRVRARRHSHTGHAHPHADHLHAPEHPHAPDPDGGWHSHGLVRHTHLPDDAGPLRRRNLVALGLVGGLVPSASAILILVGAIGAGRPALGILLTIAFGLGMAAVLVGVGMLLVRARALVERLPMAGRFDRVLALAPLGTAVAFIVVGTAITVQAGSQLL